jgi:hypothetical protein
MRCSHELISMEITCAHSESSQVLCIIHHFSIIIVLHVYKFKENKNKREVFLICHDI